MQEGTCFLCNSQPDNPNIRRHCRTSFVVYEVECGHCAAKYCGQTQQPMRSRCYQHHRESHSAQLAARVALAREDPDAPQPRVWERVARRHRDRDEDEDAEDVDGGSSSSSSSSVSSNNEDNFFYFSSAVALHHHEMHAGLQPDLTYRLLHRAQDSNDLDAHEQNYLRFGTYTINRRAEGDGIN